VIPGRAYKPEDVLRLAWQRRRLILAPFLLSAVAAAAYANWLPDQYRSETLILVVPQRVPESYVRSTVTSRIEDRLQSISQQILSRTRLERVIHDFRLYERERQTEIMENIIERMRRNIGVEIVKGDAFRISYVSGDPQSSMRVTERLASMFIDENLRDREVLAEGTSEFLSSQLENARVRLIEHEKKLEAYRRQYSGELPSQVESNLQVIQNTQLQIQSLVESLNRDRDRRLMLERLLEDQSGSPEAISAATASGDDPAAVATASGSLAERLTAARAGLASLEMRLTPEHPDVVRMKRLIADLEHQEETQALAGGTAEAIEADSRDPARRRRVRTLRAEVGALDRQIAKKEQEERRLRNVAAAYQGRVEASLTRESELAELTRDYETLQATYTGLLGKKEESQVAANLERRQIGEQFKILDPARLPEKPFSPDRPRIALLGALAGLALGIGLAAILEYRDTTIKRDDDVVMALGFPVLAIVPVMTTRRTRTRRRLLTLAVASGATVVVGAAAYWWGVLRG
jgi:polysaccharide chain length determinant protein (PEP-CTERM system associated)